MRLARAQPSPDSRHSWPWLHGRELRGRNLLVCVSENQRATSQPSWRSVFSLHQVLGAPVEKEAP